MCRYSIVKDQIYSLPNLGMVSVSISKAKKLVELTGLEPATSCVQNRRSPS
jgi:hypothetical protein